MSKMTQLVTGVYCKANVGTIKMGAELKRQWSKGRMRQFVSKEEGAGIFEYLFLGVIVGLIIIAIYSAIKGEVPGFITNIFSKFSSLT